MEVATIQMPRAEARAAFWDYQRAVRERARAEDVALMKGYKALAKGQTLLNLADVIRAAGVDDKGRPKLAVIRADAEHCWCRRYYDGAVRFQTTAITWGRVPYRNHVSLPPDTLPRIGQMIDGRAVVPIVPPRFRPRYALSGYHILWEPEWATVPRDPVLLKRIDSMLFAVLAAWDLTELERAVLARRL